MIFRWSSVWSRGRHSMTDDKVRCDGCGKKLLKSNAVVSYRVGRGNDKQTEHYHESCVPDPRDR